MDHADESDEKKNETFGINVLRKKNKESLAIAKFHYIVVRLAVGDQMNDEK